MLRLCIYGEALSMTWLIVYSWLEHAQVMYIWRGPFNDLADCLIEVGTGSGYVYMERLFIEVTDGLLEVGTCSGHVYMKRPFK